MKKVTDKSLRYSIYVSMIEMVNTDYNKLELINALTDYTFNLLKVLKKEALKKRTKVIKKHTKLAK
jgi:hypothetical protein